MFLGSGSECNDGALACATESVGERAVVVDSLHVPCHLLHISRPCPPRTGSHRNGPPANWWWIDRNWLSRRCHFACADDANPNNSNFGVLSVLNDELIQPFCGFDDRRYIASEICTYVVRGEFTHTESGGASETLGRGSAHFMSAGTGATHSEGNNSHERPLRFIQMWFTPRMRNLSPTWSSFVGSEPRPNVWTQIAGDVQKTSEAAPIKINADARIFVATIQAREDGDCKPLETIVGSGRQAYLVVLEGMIRMSKEDDTGQDVAGSDDLYLDAHEAAALWGPAIFGLHASRSYGCWPCLDVDRELFEVMSGSVQDQSDKALLAHVLLVEMQYDGSSRFSTAGRNTSRMRASQ
eukprot:gnl/TRDRNA2_/TRDRNA2_34062_c0_seq2.p1 gnl/TRDRNA2_/TRDRNA2_34062_c0~~gnl/TRDRNA2_/TRDRNA2_34062_c0_seq2.p1  ORF type:complete len:353 (+),score=30.44 gnl/TRDRNA2_/TRDRNA2_34062_c0_seq2:63-1121(+)